MSNSTDMKQPIYQRLITYAGWALASLVAFGAVLDAISNAITVITPPITYFGTVLILLFWLSVEILLKYRPISWIASDGSPIRIRGLRGRIRLGFLGIVVLLWIPLLTTKSSNNTQTDEVFEMFPMFVGSLRTYSYFRSSGPDPGPLFSDIWFYTERVIFIETGFEDNVRIIGVEQTGGNFLTCCSDESQIPGVPDLWYITDNKRLYYACSRSEAWEIANAIQHERELGTSPLLLTPEYVLPFKVGDLWGALPDDPPRDDTWYQWHVEARVDVTVPAGKFENCFRIVHFTLPDSVIRWVCPGIGLVASEYHHHGTPIDWRMELVSFELVPSL